MCSQEIIEVITELKHFLMHTDTMKQYRVSESDFSRSPIDGKSKQTFSSYALLCISSLKKSLSVELYNLLTINKLKVITKGGYSQGRYKIQSIFYKAWNDKLLSLIYPSIESNSLNKGKLGCDKKWKGYGIDSIDGSKVTVPQTKDLSAHFGTQTGGSEGNPTATAMCGVLCRADMLAGYVKDAEVFKLAVGELTVCKSWLWKLENTSITLFDRGFASANCFAFLVAQSKPFVCRLKIGFNQVVSDFMLSDATDKEVFFTSNSSEKFVHQALTQAQIAGEDPCEDCYTQISKGENVKIRLVKIVLSSGEIEILATNLYDKNEISVMDLSELYQMRWGIELIFDSLKNQLQMMVFSGIKAEAVLQEIYASVFTYNLRQLLINEAQQMVDQVQEEVVVEKVQETQQVTDEVFKKKEKTSVSKKSIKMLP